MRLHELYLTGAKLEDIAWLDSLRYLRYLNLSRTEVNDISALTDLRLRFLGLGKTRVRDLSPLADHVDLADLRLRGSPIEDISTLNPSMQLDYVDFGGLKLDDASRILGEDNVTLLLRGIPLSELPTSEDLKRLEFDCSRIDDLSPLAKLPLLERLVLENIQPHHRFDWLSNVVLRELELTSEEPIEDVSPILSMKRLRKLRLPKGSKFSEDQFAACKLIDEVYIGESLTFSRFASQD